jgi:6-phosphogluconate dehydrogenase (decarboxylating)
MKNKEKLLDDMLVRQKFMLLQNQDNTYSIIISVGNFHYKDDALDFVDQLSQEHEIDFIDVNQNTTIH